MRIRATSPVVVDSRSLFRAWRDFTAHAWKGKASKKTPQQFWDEQFAGADFRFVQWPGLPLNQGYFLSREYAALAAESGSRNATLSIIGMEPKLLRGQCIVLARALAAGGYANFDELYQTCMADNVLPRYAAWAIVDCWLRRDAAPIPSADWSKPLVADAAATDELLRSLVEREIRHQFETGVVALVNAADGGDPSQKATSA